MDFLSDPRYVAAYVVEALVIMDIGRIVCGVCWLVHALILSTCCQVQVNVPINTGVWQIVLIFQIAYCLSLCVYKGL